MSFWKKHRYFPVASGFGQMNDYLNFVYQSMQTQRVKIEKEFEEYTKGMSEEAATDYYEYNYMSEYEGYRDRYPILLYSSFIITWYSFIEQELFHVCDKLKIDTYSQKKVKNKTYSGIRLAAKALRDLAKHNIDGGHWAELLNISRMRNHIVHSGNRILFYMQEVEGVPIHKSGTSIYYLAIDEKLYKYLNKNNLLSFDGNPSISPSYEYCKRLIFFGNDLLSKIYDKLELKDSSEKYTFE